MSDECATGGWTTGPMPIGKWLLLEIQHSTPYIGEMKSNYISYHCALFIHQADISSLLEDGATILQWARIWEMP